MAALEAPVTPDSAGLRERAQSNGRRLSTARRDASQGPVVCAVNLAASSRRVLLEADGLTRALRSRLLVRVERPNEVAAIAAAEKAELVVVGLPPRWRSASVLLGRGYRTLFRDAPCPVVAVPSTAHSSPSDGPLVQRWRADSILCGIAAADGPPLAARVAADLGARMRLRPLVLHAHDPGSKISFEAIAGTPGSDPRADDAQRAWALLSRTVEQLGDSAEGRLVLGSAAPTLRRIGHRERSVLIVVGSSRRGLIRSILCGSVPAQLAGSATVPVVIVPRGARRWPGGRL